MATTSPLIIVDQKDIRGVLAPSKFFTKETLENIVDFIELSNPKMLMETKKRIREADKAKSWISGKEVEKRLRRRVKSSR